MGRAARLRAHPYALFCCRRSHEDAWLIDRSSVLALTLMLRSVCDLHLRDGRVSVREFAASRLHHPPTVRRAGPLRRDLTVRNVSGGPLLGRTVRSLRMVPFQRLTRVNETSDRKRNVH